MRSFDKPQFPKLWRMFTFFVGVYFHRANATSNQTLVSLIQKLRIATLKLPIRGRSYLTLYPAPSCSANCGHQVTLGFGRKLLADSQRFTQKDTSRRMQVEITPLYVGVIVSDCPLKTINYINIIDDWSLGVLYRRLWGIQLVSQSTVSWEYLSATGFMVPSWLVWSLWRRMRRIVHSGLIRLSGQDWLKNNCKIFWEFTFSRCASWVAFI